MILYDLMPQSFRLLPPAMSLRRDVSSRHPRGCSHQPRSSTDARTPLCRNCVLRFPVLSAALILSQNAGNAFQTFFRAPVKNEPACHLFCNKSLFSLPHTRSKIELCLLRSMLRMTRPHEGTEGIDCQLQGVTPIPSGGVLENDSTVHFFQRALGCACAYAHLFPVFS